jgi:hypothetical protein
MKACLYNEEEQPIDAIDEKELATADQKPAKADPPRQGYYLVNFSVVTKTVLIALVIFLIWIALELILTA